jgi:hypothetical protein
MSTKAEKVHMARVAALGCVLCLRLGYGASLAEVHHVRTGTGAGRRAPDTDTIGLCPLHHRLGNFSLHTMGRKAFERHYNITELDLLAEVRRILGAVS